MALIKIWVNKWIPKETSYCIRSKVEILNPDERVCELIVKDTKE